MRNSLCVVTLAMSAVYGLAPRAAAQPMAPPTIRSVTLQPDTGVLTITGSSFGADLKVIVDGQPVMVLPGATATQVEVVAPATILTTPGTYRLTVVDPVRQIGDTFVVASQPATVGVGNLGVSGTPAAESTAAPAFNGPNATSAAAAASRTYGPSPLTVIEDAGPPYRTAIGFEALVSNTSSGTSNTASGYQALRSNTTGFSNTASGSEALYSNSTGSRNTASGYQALWQNTTGFDNTASGYRALRINTTGSDNTANGAGALASNSTGYANTASGRNALFYNTTGYFNTASGYNALYNNTTGADNTANGAGALFSNTTGTDNTASGREALVANATGFFNTASGGAALYSNTTGATNTASGVSALYSNLTGDANTATGASALSSNTSGASKTALGYAAGNQATTGSFNVFLGAQVTGTAADANTIRIGLPYDGGTGVGQNRTFIAGIRGTQLTGSAVQVFIDANGQLGTLTPPIVTGTLTLPVSQLQQQVSAQQKQLQRLLDQQTTALQLQQQLREQQSVNADLRARLARLEALSLSAGRK